VGRTEDWGRFHRLEDVAGDLYLGSVGQLHNNALEDAPAEGDPDQLPRFQRKMLGNAIGERTARPHRGIHRYFYVRHGARAFARAFS